MITFSMLLTSFRVLKMIVNHYLIFSNPVVRFFHLHGNSVVQKCDLHEPGFNYD